MHKQRMISTKFWSDGWIREKLNQLDRYLFLYFLTNEHTKISGIYELPISTMAFETGFVRDELLDTMLPRLIPKVYYIDGWVVMPNFLKHQHTTSPKIAIGIEAELAKVPSDVMKKAIEYGYPMATLSHINTNTNYNNNNNTKARAPRLGKDLKENPNWLDANSWEAWERYKRERKQTLTASTRKGQLKILEANKADQKEIINNSITNGWTGLFPLKKGKEAKVPRVFKAT